MDKAKRYQRIHTQLAELLLKSSDFEARMSTVTAVLHHKMDKFFWTGFYCLRDGKLIVRTYQGSLACMELKKDVGVCWAAVNQNLIIVVPDVEKFPGHIACDSRSKSEIAVPLRDKSGNVIAVLDIDSKELNTFDDTDAHWLEKIVELI